MHSINQGTIYEPYALIILLFTDLFQASQSAVELKNAKKEKLLQSVVIPVTVRLFY